MGSGPDRMLGAVELCQEGHSDEIVIARNTILPYDALSAQDEAIAVREYLENKKDAGSLIIVTSKPHSGRAKRIFAKAMGSMDREIRVVSCPTEHDDFNTKGWWKNREDLKRGVLEYLKLFNFYIRERFEL